MSAAQTSPTDITAVNAETDRCQDCIYFARRGNWCAKHAAQLDRHAETCSQFRRRDDG